MVWIFAAIVLLLALLSPRLRKFGLAIAGAAILVIVVLIWLNGRQKPHPAPAADAPVKPPTHARMVDFAEFQIERRDKDDPEAKSRIPLGEVKFGQIRPVFGPQANVVQSIQARLYNDSAHFSLTDYAYHLVVQDCVGATAKDTAGTECTAVYDQRQRGAPVVVPPRQARDITIPVPIDSTTLAPAFKILGEPRIELVPTETRAYRSADQPQPAEASPSERPG